MFNGVSFKVYNEGHKYFVKDISSNNILTEIIPLASNKFFNPSANYFRLEDGMHIYNYTYKAGREPFATKIKD